MKNMKILINQNKILNIKLEKLQNFYVSLKGCKVIFGSATPSIESYYKAISGEMKLIEMNNRVDKKPMPKMQIVDMRNELKSGKCLYLVENYIIRLMKL